MRQVHLSLGPAGCHAAASKDDTELAQHHHEQRLLAQCPAGIWPHGSYRAACPRPILVARAHCRQLTALHGALAAAIHDIVPRWWRDEEAAFPRRMPLGDEEEALLKVRGKEEEEAHCRLLVMKRLVD